MSLRRKPRRAAGYAAAIMAMIAGAACLAFAQNGPHPRAAAGLVAIPMASPTGNPAPNPRNARPGERIRVVRIDALKGDASFAEFRDDLEGVIKRRDAQANYRVVSRDFETHSVDDEDLAGLSPFEQFKRTASKTKIRTRPSTIGGHSMRRFASARRESVLHTWGRPIADPHSQPAWTIRTRAPITHS